MRARNARTGIVAALWGSALIGAALLAPLLGVEQAFAGPGACSVLCGKTALTSGPAHAACLQACRKCGGDVSRICPLPSPFPGTTISPICCPSGNTCCVGPALTPTCCAAGTSCVAGQCAQGCCFPTCADTCTLGGPGCDGGTPGCGCGSTTEGAATCASGELGCLGVPCNSSAECGGTDTVCVRLGP